MVEPTGIQAYVRDPDFWLGVPIDPRVNLSLVKPTDADQQCVRAQHIHHHRLFDLSVKADHEEYQQVRSDALSKQGGVVELVCDRHFVVVDNKHRVLVDYEWYVTHIVPYADKPTSTEQDLDRTQQQQQPTHGQVICNVKLP